MFDNSVFEELRLGLKDFECDAIFIAKLHILICPPLNDRPATTKEKVLIHHRFPKVSRSSLPFLIGASVFYAYSCFRLFRWFRLSILIILYRYSDYKSQAKFCFEEK